MADTARPQDETWDDSDLLTSWNEAFAEYKKYHSIAAKGGKIETKPTTAATNRNGLINGDATAIANEAQDEAIDSDDYVPTLDQTASKSGGRSDADFAAGHESASVPQLLAGATVQDDNMKSLMMSWYYAGYYTGLYEGKQQGYASAVQQQRLQQPQQGG